MMKICKKCGYLAAWNSYFGGLMCQNCGHIERDIDYEMGKSMKTNKTLYDFVSEFERLMDDALDSLSPDIFDRFKDDILKFIEDIED